MKSKVKSWSWFWTEFWLSQNFYRAALNLVGFFSIRSITFFKGLYTLVLEKKGHFYDFFLEKQHNFFQKTERLFIFACHKVFYEFFQKKIFITGVTTAIVPAIFPTSLAVSMIKKELLIWNTQNKKNCSLYLHALS